MKLARLYSALQDPRIQRIALLVIVLVAFVVRFSKVMEVNFDHPNSAPNLVGDEPGYDNMARELLAGFGFTWPGRVPLYSLWLAGVYFITNGSIESLRYIQIFLALSTIVLVYWLARREFNPQVGLIAAFGSAIVYPLIFQTVRVLSEVLYTPLILLVVLALYNFIKQPTVRTALWLGVWIGLSNLTRPALLMFPFFLLLLFIPLQGWGRGLKHGAYVLLASLIVVAPWQIHNMVKYNAFFPLQTSNAILWQGSPEYYHLTHEQGYTYRQVWSDVLYSHPIDPTSVEGDRYWTDRALTSIRLEPDLYLLFAFEKLFTYWIGDPNADWYDSYPFDFFRLTGWAGFRAREALQIMFGRFVPVLAFAALFFIRKQWHSLAPILVTLAYFNLLHAATHAEVRLSEPLLPLLFIFIALAVDKWLTPPPAADAVPANDHE